MTTVDKIFKHLDVAKTSGIDQISAKFFEDGAPVITIHLANVINLSIKLETFSSKCNMAKMNFWLKRSLISRVIEKSIHDQTQDYLDGKELLYIYQSSFIANRSTDTCLSRLTDITLNGTENEKYTEMILIDLQKSFDTLDYKILFDKMNSISISFYRHGDSNY